MSVQMGIWNRDGKPIDSSWIEQTSSVISPYGTDGCTAYARDNIGIAFSAFHTTKEARRDVQPHLSTSGVVVVWDGRLDNRAELVRDLGGSLTCQSTDIEIVAASYETWGIDFLARLLGDWALAIWDARANSLILAKDVIGIRPLYYCVDKQCVTWSSILEPLVTVPNKSWKIDEEYLAGWLSFYPATHLTPFAGIHSVPPASFVVLTSERRAIKKYWDFDSSKIVTYATDGEYDDHFRTVFRNAVWRRLRTNGAIIAELSGGMDSSSIVCMANEIVANGNGETSPLNTISYYNNAEPNWNEMPYIAAVEKRLGRVGFHMNVGRQEMFRFDFENDELKATPASIGGLSTENGKQLCDFIKSVGARVVLSGVGGDEVMGGVPSPIPELQDLLLAVRLRDLVHKLKIWAIDKRVPWFHLLLEAMRGFLPTAIVPASRSRRPMPWINPDFVRRNKRAFEGYESRLRLLTPRPSFQTNIYTIEQLRRQIASASVSFPMYEKRYPFLDRDLLEFVYAIPRSQMVRPGRRRLLMRRALAGLVPNEIIERKRKAFLSRSPLVAISSEWANILELTQHMNLASLGVLNQDSLAAILLKAKHHNEVPVTRLMRTLLAEAWLRKLRRHGIRLDIHEQALDVVGRPGRTQISSVDN